PPQPTPFPYTTLFRSTTVEMEGPRGHRSAAEKCQRDRHHGDNEGHANDRDGQHVPHPPVDVVTQFVAVVHDDEERRDRRGQEERSEEHTSELQSRSDL